MQAIYLAAAKAVRAMRTPRYAYQTLRARQLMAASLANHFAEVDQEFNREAFMAACDVVDIEKD